MTWQLKIHLSAPIIFLKTAKIGLITNGSTSVVTTSNYHLKQVKTSLSATTLLLQTITHDICIFYLGGVAGDEGPLLNILKTSDNHYYFDYFVYDTVHYNDKKAIHIIKETSLDTIKRLFGDENLDFLRLYDIFDPKDGRVFYETEEHTFEATTYKTVKERFESTVDNYEFLGILNWFYDDTKSDDILPSILNELESEN